MMTRTANGASLLRVDSTGAGVKEPQVLLSTCSPHPRLELLEKRLLLSAGALDESFDGYIDRDASDVELAVQSDGKVLVAGTAEIAPAGRSLFVERLNADGSVDKSFAVNGLYHTAIGGGTQYSDLNEVDIGIDSSGKVVAAASNVIVRLTSSGKPDTAFSGDGILTAPTRISDLAVQPDHAIVAGGAGTLWRFTPTGAVDATFASTGAINIGAFIGNDSFYLTDIRLDSAKRIVVLGNTGRPPPAAQVGSSVVLRLLPDGRIDRSFGQPDQARAGWITRQITGHDVALTALVQPDGGILIGSFESTDSYESLVGRVWRLSENGSVDADFGYSAQEDAGGPRTEFGGSLHALALQPDGKIIALLSGYSGAGVYRLARLSRDGSFDPSFDADSYADSSGWGFSTPMAMAYSNGNVIVARRGYEATWDDPPPPVVVITRNNLGSDPVPDFARVSQTGTLLISGSGGGDEIIVKREQNVVAASLGNWAGSQAILGTLYFDTASVQRIAIDAGAGDDYIWIGASYRATVLGGAGDDGLEAPLAGSVSLNGGAGDDWLFGGSSDDTLYGGEGNDLLEGALGADEFMGGPGEDDADYGDHVDHKDSSGRPIILSLTLDRQPNDGAPGEGDNLHDDVENLYGSGGDDYIVGNRRPNKLFGTPGNDTLVGGHGSDTLAGDADGDVLIGGPGRDWADYGSVGWPLTITIGGYATQHPPDREYPPDLLSLTIEKVIGGLDNDWICGSKLDNVLMGGSGKDTLIGGKGRDALFGGAGNDRLGSGDGNDYLEGGSGNDTMDGGRGNDTLLGQSGKDLLLGLDGAADRLEGGSGRDRATRDLLDLLVSIQQVIA